MVPGGGIEPPMSLRPKVFEFLVRLAPSVTIGHVWSIFSNLDASTSWLIWHMVPSGSSWCWHKTDTVYRPAWSPTSEEVRLHHPHQQSRSRRDPRPPSAPRSRTTP